MRPGLKMSADLTYLDGKRFLYTASKRKALQKLVSWYHAWMSVCVNTSASNAILPKQRIS